MRLALRIAALSILCSAWGHAAPGAPLARVQAQGTLERTQGRYLKTLSASGPTTLLYETRALDASATVPLASWRFTVSDDGRLLTAEGPSKDGSAAFREMVELFGDSSPSVAVRSQGLLASNLLTAARLDKITPAVLSTGFDGGEQGQDAPLIVRAAFASSAPVAATTRKTRLAENPPVPKTAKADACRQGKSWWDSAWGDGVLDALKDNGSWSVSHPEALGDKKKCKPYMDGRKTGNTLSVFIGAFEGAAGVGAIIVAALGCFGAGPLAPGCFGAILKTLPAILWGVIHGFGMLRTALLNRRLSAEQAETVLGARIVKKAPFRAEGTVIQKGDVYLVLDPKDPRNIRVFDLKGKPMGEYQATVAARAAR